MDINEQQGIVNELLVYIFFSEVYQCFELCFLVILVVNIFIPIVESFKLQVVCVDGFIYQFTVHEKCKVMKAGMIPEADHCQCIDGTLSFSYFVICWRFYFFRINYRFV